MRTLHHVASLVVLSIFAFTDHGLASDSGHFLNEWTAGIPGGLDHATAVAAQHGYTLVRELHNLPDHYILKRSDTPHRHKRSARHHTKRLAEDHRVYFVQQQQERLRDKREMSPRDLAREIATGSDLSRLNDPSFSHEWYLHPQGDQARRDNSEADLRVKDAWKLGFTGKGVVATILDDGLESTHPDIADNYDMFASYDYNDNDHDPFPRYDITNENKHGTRCAGEIAMVANNGACGVGIAFDAGIGGVRMLDGTVTDRVESEALAFNLSHVDIYSASWGPTDDATKLEKPGLLASKAILKGIQEGRGGKGVLYAWASGNGGRVSDTCNADGYSSSIYTIAISSATEFGTSPWYAEKCASTMTTAYSSGTGGERKVTSTDLHHKCTDDHSGTSAAAPMGAGLLALLLQANPDLNWREVQHIIAHTSRKGPLAGESGWYKNAAGYCVNLKFGFGLMDALAMVQLGRKENWTPIGEQHICRVVPTEGTQLPQEVSSGQVVEVEFQTTGCQGQDNEVNFLEHVVVNLDLSYPSRGRISVELESPGGTNVEIMSSRDHDRSPKGFVNWPLMSVHTWGEKPQGTWKLRVMDKHDGDLTGSLKNVSLVLHGTKEQPEYQKNNPKKCGDGDIADAPKESNSQSDDAKVENTIDNLKILLKSDKSSYIQNKLTELLEARKSNKLGSQDRIARLLEELGGNYYYS